MSEPVDLATGAAPEPAQASAVQAGMLLRQAREAHGLHVAAMAFSLKVPVSKLEALEAGRLNLLPDVTFARGLAASVCRNLKVDPAPVLDLLPRNGSSRLGVEAPAINTPFRPPGTGPSFGLRGRMFSPAVIAVLVLLVGALLLWLVPRVHDEEAVAISSTEPAAPALMEPAPASTPAEVLPPATEPSAVASVAVATMPPVAASPAAPASSVVSGDAASAAFLLTAKGESWVKVTDAKGVVALNRTIQPGESVQATGALPLAVVIGRADAVQVQVHGQPFDLAPLTKVNVARFEVK